MCVCVFSVSGPLGAKFGARSGLQAVDTSQGKQGATCPYKACHLCTSCPWEVEADRLGQAIGLPCHDAKNNEATLANESSRDKGMGGMTLRSAKADHRRAGAPEQTEGSTDHGLDHHARRPGVPLKECSPGINQNSCHGRYPLRHVAESMQALAGRKGHDHRLTMPTAPLAVGVRYP